MINLSTLIGSCDLYTPLLKPFQICFNKYWDINSKNIIITETIDVPNYTNTNFNIVKSTGNWGSRMLKGLDLIDTDYVFFILDDYFLQYKHPKNTIENYINLMEKHNLDRLQISPSGYQKYTNNVIENITEFSNQSNYLISLQPSIWRKEFIYKTLNPSYNPWEYELIGSKKLLNTDCKIYIDTNAPMMYWNAVRKGRKKSPGWDQFFKKENIKQPEI